MNFKKIIQDRSGFTWPAAAITMLIAIAIIGIGGAVAVDYVFKQAEKELKAETFESCVKRTGDAEECQKAGAQQPKVETADKKNAETPSAGSPKPTADACAKFTPEEYSANKDECDKILTGGATFE